MNENEVEGVEEEGDNDKPVVNQPMKICVVGAGPAGLYFSLLMMKLNPHHRIKIVEQNPAGATYGWGVVFSDRVLSFMQDNDLASYQAIVEQKS